MQQLDPSWRKSSYSINDGNPNCVEVGAWRKASYSINSGGANCVEAGMTPGAVLVRDTTNRGGVTLSVASAAWESFLSTLR